MSKFDSNKFFDTILVYYAPDVAGADERETADVAVKEAGGILAYLLEGKAHFTELERKVAQLRAERHEAVRLLKLSKTCIESFVGTGPLFFDADLVLQDTHAFLKKMKDE